MDKAASEQNGPCVSIVMPCYNGRRTLDRAISSVLSQDMTKWELIIVDDCSTDGSYETALKWVAEDARIQVHRGQENRGGCASRNLALRRSIGEFVSYLDCDDEYYPHYLASIVPFFRQCDVVLCGYDIFVEGASTDRPAGSWDPAQRRGSPFGENINTPLGVAHRRSLLDAVGGFNELLWFRGDAEFWRRLARTGAEFAFLPVKAGKYFKRFESQSRKPRIAASIASGVISNRAVGRPLYEVSNQRIERSVRKIAFVAPSSVIDFSSGAAVATLRQLSFLRRLGFSCQAFCGSHLDVRQEELIEETLSRRSMQYEVRRGRVGSTDTRLIFASHEDVPITLYCSSSTARGLLVEGQVNQFMQAFGRFLDANRPDAILTYGGDSITRAMILMAKAYDIPVVFFVHNFAYTSGTAFEYTDYAAVPSEFSRAHYWSEVGLDCGVLPNIIDDEAIRVRAWRPAYVTLVNPQPTKGLFVFVSIAQELARRRPDIPLLVVEGRGRTDAFEALKVPLEQLGNLRVMPNTPWPREFYEVSKLLLMPSLWRESFGLAAAEAMYNGIPVLASDRGALPEIVGDGGFLFSIPERYTPQTRDIPTAEEVEPWVETIIRLWDDPQEYASASDRARNHAQRWHPDRLAPLYRKFFSNLAPQPFPPLAPPGVR